jgi:hypothetical protein
MIIFTPDGVILKVNNALAQMFGYKKEEMVGKYFLNIYCLWGYREKRFET